MKTRKLGVLISTVLLLLQVLLSCAFSFKAYAQTSPEVYIGVHMGYGDVQDAKERIDQISPYANLFVIGSATIAWNSTKLNETCQYAYDKGLSFISLAHGIRRTAWYEYADQAWGKRFLGYYTFDEPAGHQLDRNETRFGNSTPSSNLEAADLFENNLGSELEVARSRLPDWTDYKLFTADYALYWFDYKAGYDVILAELGWNYSRQLNIALCRGAATVQNKDWGAIVLWTYTVPPYIESGAELYKDLVLAYDNGAKYILIFDSNENHTQGILGEEHLQALRQFWEYTRNNPRGSYSQSTRIAYVLPYGYGYGFRGPEDKIWGLWEADDLSYNLSVSVGSLLDEYGSKLDIIYDDGLQISNNNGYSKLVFWYSYNPPISSSSHDDDQDLSASSPPPPTLASETLDSSEASPSPPSSPPPQPSIPEVYVCVGMAGIILLVFALFVRAGLSLRSYITRKM